MGEVKMGVEILENDGRQMMKGLGDEKFRSQKIKREDKDPY